MTSSRVSLNTLLLLASSSFVFGSAAAQSPARAGAGSTADEVLIIGKREARTSKGATNLPLSLADTPQSVTVIDREYIDAFGLHTANDVLKLTTGIDVEEVETDRTYYTARGFDIKSMQVDGLGLPFNWNVVGALDTAVYDKVEAIRGANGLLTGTGNPSGTINYVRKRPTNEFQADGRLSIESYDVRRGDFDISGPLTDSDRWAGRLVVAAQSGDSHLDHYQNDRSIFYGVLDGQVGERTTLTFGFTNQDNKSKGVLWGALPLLYSDGGQTDFATSGSTTMDWTYWQTHTRSAFAEVAYELPRGWELKAVLTRNEYEEPSELFYVYSYPSFDRSTGLGLYGWPGKFEAASDQSLLDATFGGSFTLGERQHDFLLGFNASNADHEYYESAADPSDPAWGALPAFPGWQGNEISRPAFSSTDLAGQWNDEVRRIYGAARFRAAKALDLIVGFNSIDLHSNGFNFGESMDRSARETTPYVGMNYVFADKAHLYASYSDIFEPQSEFTESLQPIGNAVGKSYEIGWKGEFFDRRLLGSASVFRAEQANYAEYAGLDTTTGISFYKGVDVDSKGYELEMAGRIGERLHLFAGYTHVDLKTPEGSKARTFVPRDTFKLGTRYEPSRVRGLELGGTLRWQDEIHIDTANGTVRQGAYAVLSAHVRYAFSKRLELALNINNLTDEKYLTSLYWDQSFYAAPRNAALSVRVVR